MFVLLWPSRGSWNVPWFCGWNIVIIFSSTLCGFSNVYNNFDFFAQKKTTRTSFIKLGIELANWRMKNCRVHIVTFARSTRYTRHTSQTHWKPRLRLTPSWTHCGDGEKWSKWGLNQGDSCAINGSICTPLDKNLSIELWEKFKATSREIMLSIFTTRWRRIN